jgi:hypothetical protein
MLGFDDGDLLILGFNDALGEIEGKLLSLGFDDRLGEIEEIDIDGAIVLSMVGVSDGFIGMLVGGGLVGILVIVGWLVGMLVGGRLIGLLVGILVGNFCFPFHPSPVHASLSHASVPKPFHIQSVGPFPHGLLPQVLLDGRLVGYWLGDRHRPSYSILHSRQMHGL